jgi:hypothetical protein
MGDLFGITVKTMAAIIELSHRKDKNVIVIEAHFNCPVADGQVVWTDDVATVVEPENPNPGILFTSRSGGCALGMVEKIAAYVRSKPWA